MTIEEFLAICKQGEPPASLPKPLTALYWDARGQWDKAHAAAQSIQTPDGSLIHAYLHRKEGDRANARYWYDRAGRAVCGTPLEEEWRAIAAEICEKT